MVVLLLEDYDDASDKSRHSTLIGKRENMSQRDQQLSLVHEKERESKWNVHSPDKWGMRKQPRANRVLELLFNVAVRDFRRSVSISLYCVDYVALLKRSKEIGNSKAHISSVRKYHNRDHFVAHKNKQNSSDFYSIDLYALFPRNSVGLGTDSLTL